MSLRPLASLLVKMLGLYAFINALPVVSHVLFPLLVPSLYSPASRGSLSPWLLAFLEASGGALQMLVGVGFWWFSDGIAQSAVREDDEVSLRRDEGLIAIGFSVVGAYLLVDCMAGLTRYGFHWYMINQSGLFSSSSGTDGGPGELLPLLVRGALAVYLLLGTRGMARGIASFKNVGRDHVVEEAE